MERMQKAKDLGNGFMKAKINNSKTNRKDDSDYQTPRRANAKLSNSDTQLPRIKNNMQMSNQNLYHDNPNPYFNNNLNKNYNQNSLSNNQLNQKKNYESFDFLTSNDDYYSLNNNKQFNQNSNFSKYSPPSNNDEYNLNLKPISYQGGFQSEQASKLYKNPRFDFSNKNSQPVEPNNNARTRVYY
jgi:hypothetical protein